jgi:hypothetical protein
MEILCEEHGITFQGSLTAEEVKRLQKGEQAIVRELVIGLVGEMDVPVVVKVSKKQKKKKGKKKQVKTRARRDRLPVGEVKAYIKDFLKGKVFARKTEILQPWPKMRYHVYGNYPNVFSKMVTDGEIYEYVMGKDIVGERGGVVYSLLKREELPKSMVRY